jgi:hypothetical protein
MERLNHNTKIEPMLQESIEETLLPVLCVTIQLKMPKFLI